MKVDYEDDYSDCQVRCLLCGKTGLLNQANYSGFHKVCEVCVRNEVLNDIRQCLHCSSQVKVLKSVKNHKIPSNRETATLIIPQRNQIEEVKMDERVNLDFYSINYKSPELDKKEENKRKEEILPSYMTADSKRAELNAKEETKKKNFYYDCPHPYCRLCREKNKECFMCTKLWNRMCIVCLKDVRLEKRGEYWKCGDCGYHFIECIPCQSFSTILAQGFMCEFCNCYTGKQTTCSHNVCKNCLHRNQNICAICYKNQDIKCKFCEALDIMCIGSVCPYCSPKGFLKNCLSCKVNLGQN